MRRPSIFWIVTLVLVFPLFIWGGMNKSGFCWAEKRWVTPEEKIATVIDFINSAKMARVNDPDNKDSSIYILMPTYKNAEEALRAHPDCCHYDSSIGGSGSFFGESMHGSVFVDLPMKYLDEHRQTKIVKIPERISFTNCGEIYNHSHSLTHR